MVPDVVPSSVATTPRVLIFDWDDTICPSSFVDRWQIENVAELPYHFQKLFTELAICAERCLEEASKFGEVIIITNSDDGWVKYSAERFVPRLLHVVDKYPIVSARTEYEQFYPGQPLCWKAAAFAHEVNEIHKASAAGREAVAAVSMKTDEEAKPSPSVFEKTDCDGLESTDVSSVVSNSTRSSSGSDLAMTDQEDDQEEGENQSQREQPEVLSFGDSMEERIAVQIISRQLSAVSKSVMFIQTPNPIQLIGQLHMITSHMKYICERPSTLDLEITLDQAERYSTRYMKRNHCEYLPKTIIPNDKLAAVPDSSDPDSSSTPMQIDAIGSPTDSAVTASPSC